MPRTLRASQGGYVYHVLNRVNGRGDVFHKAEDYLAFVNLMRESNERLPMRVVGYCLLTNHFQLMLWPFEERNPLRADMVQRSQEWEWSSLKTTLRSGPPGLLSEGPLLKSSGWTQYVHNVETEAELASLRQSVARGTPFGGVSWQEQTAIQLGLESSMRPRGRQKVEK